MKAQTMQRLRQVHHYVGVFFAPAIIFFALSGALQTLGLHESHDPSRPPVGWIQWMGSVHKDQRVPSAHTDGGGHGVGLPNGDDHDARPPARASERKPQNAGPSPIPLKAFVLLLAIALITTSSLGVTIALNNRLTRRTSLGLLVGGATLPILLLYL